MNFSALEKNPFDAVMTVLAATVGSEISSALPTQGGFCVEFIGYFKRVDRGAKSGGLLLLYQMVKMPLRNSPPRKDIIVVSF